MITFPKLVDHYIQIKRVQDVGGLRKELTPETCVYMYILHYDPKYNHLEAIALAAKVKYAVQQINQIPF